MIESFGCRDELGKIVLPIEGFSYAAVSLFLAVLYKGAAAMDDVNVVPQAQSRQAGFPARLEI